MNKFFPKFTISNHLFYALKIGLGSALAIYLAELLQLDFSSSAGIITLLSIAGTKMETKQLGVDRLTTFVVMVGLAILFHFLIGPEWVAYGISLVFLTFLLSLRSKLVTLSVNAVAMGHLLRLEQITVAAVINEFCLLLIGLLIALVINYLQNYESQKRFLQQAAVNVEKDIQRIFTKLSDYLHDPEAITHVWDDIIRLEKKLFVHLKDAFQYQQNRLPIVDDYFVEFFEMRLQQTSILHNLHYEMKKIRNQREDAEVLAWYFEQIVSRISEMNDPAQQIEILEMLLKQLQLEHIPETPEEFMNKARLYHILMDIEEFLILKKRFVAQYGSQYAAHMT